MTKNYSKSNLSQNYTRHLVRGNVTGNLSINSAVRFSAIYGDETDRLKILKKIQKEKTFRFWWYIIFAVAAIVCLGFFPSSYLSVIQMFVLMINIDLLSRGKVIGIYVGILDCLLYITICSMSGLWGEVIKMAAINIPLNIVAIINWTRNLKKQSGKEQSIDIKKLTKKSFAICVVTFLMALVSGYFFLKYLNTASLIISTISLAIGIISKILSGQRYMEAYAVMIVGNVISLALWISMLTSGSADGAPVQIVMYLANLSDSIYSYFLWRGMYRKKTVNGGKLLAKRKIKINKVIKLRRVYKNLYWNKEVDINKNS